MKKITLVFIFFCRFIIQINAQIADSSYFIISTKGEITYVDSLILVEEAYKNPYILVDGSHKYGLNELTSYSGKNGNYRRFIDSFDKFSSWYKLESKGKINFYSKPNTMYSNSASTRMANGQVYNPRIRSTEDVFYTQIGDEIPQELTYLNLQKLLKSNPKSMVLLKKGRQTGTIKRALAIVGTAALLLGGYQTIQKARANNFEGGVKVPPLVVVGLGTIFAPLLIKSPESKYIKAVEVFNQ